MNKMRIKSTTIGISDIEPLIISVQSYRAYLRGTNPADERHRLQTLDALHQHLQGMLLRSRNGAAILPLMAEELRVLRGALQGWAAILRQIIPPSRERDGVIASTLALARDLEPMLSS